MHVKPKKMLETLVVAWLAAHAQAVLADALTDQAAQLIRDGKGAEAYGVLEPSEAGRAGDSSFDLLLGIAAIEAGQHTRAVFALERVLALEPNNVRARAEIARAYLALGETQAAKQEFETVKKQGIPADVSLTIDRYIAAASRFEDERKTSISGYLEAIAGYDTNVNVGPNKNTVSIPGFGGLPFTLSQNTKANADWFASLGGGLNVRTPLLEGLALLAGASGTQRYNSRREQFDMTSGDANLGLSATRDNDVFTVMGQAGTVSVEGDRYRDAFGLTGQWQRNLDARNQVGAFLQYSNLHYRGQDARDADRWVAGANYAHLYRSGTVTYLTGYVVDERVQLGMSPWLSFSGVGAKVGGRLNYDPQTALFANFTYEYRRYDRVDPAFLTTRRDNQYGVTLGAAHSISKEWTVTPQLNLTLNQSNTALNEYHREMFSVTVRREF